MNETTIEMIRWINLIFWLGAGLTGVVFSISEYLKSGFGGRWWLYFLGILLSWGMWELTDYLLEKLKND